MLNVNIDTSELVALERNKYSIVRNKEDGTISIFNYKGDIVVKLCYNEAKNIVIVESKDNTFSFDRVEIVCSGEGKSVGIHGYSFNKSYLTRFLQFS